MQRSWEVSALFHPAFNEPVEGVVSISYRSWSSGRDLQIEIDEIPVLSIPMCQVHLFRKLLEEEF